MRFMILPLLLLTACGESVQNAPQPGATVQLPDIEWRVRDRAGLEAAYRNSGMTIGAHARLEGFAGRDGGRAVIYTLPPRYVDDDVACTLGHEVMHVVLGEYHH